MTDSYRMYSILPLPGTAQEQFENVMRASVIPTVRSGQTRGGEVTSEVLYRTGSGHYRWIVGLRGTSTGAGFVRDHIDNALAELSVVGVIYSEDHLTLLDSTSSQPPEDVLPTGSAGS